MRGAASALQISTIEFFAKKVTNVYLKALTVLNKSSILDALIGLEYASASRYSLVLKIQTEMSPWKQVKMASFQSTISIWSLGQLIV